MRRFIRRQRPAAFHLGTETVDDLFEPLQLLLDDV
jgi:hypothetical protein